MTGEFDRPDRFGCGGIAMMLFGILLAIAVIVAYLMFNFLGFTGFGPGPGGGNGGPGGGNAGPGTVTYRGSDGTGDLPIISLRDFTGGEAPLTASGAFSLGDTFPLHPPATFADGTETTLMYGEYPVGDGILLGFSNLEGSEGLGLNVQSGPWLATYQGHGCNWAVEVSQTSLSGHVSCNAIPAVNQDDGTTGSIDVVLDFSADSPDAAASSSPG